MIEEKATDSREDRIPLPSPIHVEMCNLEEIKSSIKKDLAKVGISIERFEASVF